MKKITSNLYSIQEYLNDFNIEKEDTVIINCKVFTWNKDIHDDIDISELITDNCNDIAESKLYLKGFKNNDWNGTKEHHVTFEQFIIDSIEQVSNVSQRMYYEKNHLVKQVFNYMSNPSEYIENPVFDFDFCEEISTMWGYINKRTMVEVSFENIYLMKN